jgi:hypothetical protein
VFAVRRRLTKIFVSILSGPLVLFMFVCIIADLGGAGSIARVHAAEALTYRYRPAIPAMPRQGSAKGASLAS